MASGARLSGEQRCGQRAAQPARALCDRPEGLYYDCGVRLKADTTDVAGLKTCTTTGNVGLKADSTDD